MRLMLFLVVAAVLLLPATGRADDGQILDRHDVHGLLDIAAVTQAHTDGAVVHTVRTHRSFPSRALRGENGIVFMLDTNGDLRIDRLVLVLYVGSTLHAVVADEHARLVGKASVTRPDRHSVSVNVPLTLLHNPGVYRWGALTLYKDRRSCSHVCRDRAPNRGFVIHDLVPQDPLSITVNGSGHVRSAQPGIECPPTCSATYRRNSGVTLQATPADGWTFQGWSGACTGTGVCTVVMTDAESVTATFVPVYTLTVSSFGPGYVDVNPPDGPCTGGPCTFHYTKGTTVLLTAPSGPTYAFDGWDGDCSGTATTCAVTMDANKTVTAHFSVRSFTLSVAIDAQGGATGRVVSSSPGIDCPGDCAESYTAETFVTLFAVPGPGSVFRGWENSIWCQGTRADCMVPMGGAFPGDKAVMAAFGPA